MMNFKKVVKYLETDFLARFLEELSVHCLVLIK